MSPAAQKRWLLATAFGEGMAVLVVEIAGARALAPYFGSSLRVWTAQITATLLFLALGYGLGGRLCRAFTPSRLPQVLWAAGLWLTLYPFLRNPLLSGSASAGVAAGSFLASAALFGLPLLCLGAVSPLLIQRLDRIQAGSGAAAGALFFTNTLGGLAGGWLTALLLIPHLPLRLALAGTGVFLALLGSAWALAQGGSKAASSALPLTALLLCLAAPKPPVFIKMGGQSAVVVMRRQSGVGLIQVVDVGPYGRSLMIDGVTQGGMSKETGTSVYEFTEYLNFMSHRYHPRAKSALLLGLGCGLLAKQLDKRGLKVTVAELEPLIEEAARRHFGLPGGVRVIPEDGRTWLNRGGETYDLVFLDAFAGENAPWYLSTREALQRVKASLNPGGRLLVNTVTRQGGSEGLKRLESNLLEAFGEAKVYIEALRPGEDTLGLVNATLVAGADLKESGEKFPSTVFKKIEPRLGEMALRGRPALALAKATSDELSDIDYAESELRAQWRRLILESLGPEILAD